MGTLEQPRTFGNQDFKALRERHLEKGTLFSDEYFPANMDSIGWRLKDEFNTNQIEWKRPKEICQEPHLIVNGTKLFDILQSSLGDCWVLSAIGSITLKPGLMENIMPPDQGYTRSYAGIFHFRLWHLGDWVDIVIDDRLPFLNGEYLSVKPSCENEFWPCLLEKAYAKYLGSYQNLHWGDPADAFTNLTGGLTKTFDLTSTKAHLYWNMIENASPETLMACTSNKQNPTSKIQNRKPSFYAGNRRGSLLHNKLAENPLLENGLVERHAYSITDYAMVPFRDTFVKLIRVWNPWGHGEWKGYWNDRCPLWKELREKDRLRLQSTREDGAFCMCWEDFIQEFSSLIICSQVPDFLDCGNQPKKWYRKMLKCRWTKDSMTWNKIDTDFLKSHPLFSIKVTGSDKVKTAENVVISVVQNSRNRQKAGDWLPIGFLLFAISVSKDKPLNSVFTQEQISSITSFKKHSVVKAYNLAPGRYGVIPYTTQKEYESSFLLQVFLKSDDSIEYVTSHRFTPKLEAELRSKS